MVLKEILEPWILTDIVREYYATILPPLILNIIRLSENRNYDEVKTVLQKKISANRYRRELALTEVEHSSLTKGDTYKTS